MEDKDNSITELVNGRVEKTKEKMEKSRVVASSLAHYACQLGFAS